MQRQKDQYQGIWIVSPEGKVLAGHHNIKSHQTWTQEVQETLDEGLRAFGPVTPRPIKPSDPLPYRGRGVQPGGRVTLALYTRYLHHSRPDGPAVLDSLTFSAQEWAALAPAEVAVGKEWSLPEAVARQFCRALSPTSDQSTMPRPQEVTTVEVTGLVEEAAGGHVRLRYTGRIAAAHRYEGKVSHGEERLTGFGTFDPKAKQLRSLTWVFDGTHRGAPPYDQPRETGAVVEWRHEKLAE